MACGNSDRILERNPTTSIFNIIMNFLVKQTGLNFKSRFLSELSQSIQNQNSFDSAALTTYYTREFFVGTVFQEAPVAKKGLLVLLLYLLAFDDGVHGMVAVSESRHWEDEEDVALPA